MIILRKSFSKYVPEPGDIVDPDKNPMTKGSSNNTIPSNRGGITLIIENIRTQRQREALSAKEQQLLLRKNIQEERIIASKQRQASEKKRHDDRQLLETAKLERNSSHSKKGKIRSI